jgi:hypothetical protein
MDIDIVFEKKDEFSDKFITEHYDYSKESSKKNKKTQFVIYFSIKFLLFLIFDISIILHDKKLNNYNTIIIFYTTTILIMYFILTLSAKKYPKFFLNNTKNLVLFKKIFEIFTIIELEIELLLLILYLKDSSNSYGINLVCLIYLKSITFIFLKVDIVFSFFTFMKIKTITFLISIFFIILFSFEDENLKYFFQSLHLQLNFYLSNLICFYYKEIFAEKMKKLLSFNERLLNLINFLGFIMKRRNLNFLISFEFKESENIKKSINDEKNVNNKELSIFSNNFINEMNITKINNLKFLNFDNLDFNNIRFRNKKADAVNFQKYNNINSKTYSIIKDSSLFFQERESYFNQNKNMKKPRSGNYNGNKLKRSSNKTQPKKFSTSVYKNTKKISGDSNNLNYLQNQGKREVSAPLNERKMFDNSNSRISSSNKSNNLLSDNLNNNNLMDKNSIYYIRSDSLMDKSSSLNFIDNSSKKNLTINSANSNYKAESGFESNVSSDESDNISSSNNKTIRRRSSSFIDSSEINEFRNSSLLRIKTSKTAKTKSNYYLKSEKDELLRINVNSKEENSLIKNENEYCIEINTPLSNSRRNNNNEIGILRTNSLKSKKKKSNTYNINNYSRSENFLSAFSSKGINRSNTINNKLEQINEVNEEENKSKSLNTKKFEYNQKKGQNRNLLRNFSYASEKEKDKTQLRRKSLDISSLQDRIKISDTLKDEKKNHDYSNGNNLINNIFKFNQIKILKIITMKMIFNSKLCHLEKI